MTERRDELDNQRQQVSNLATAITNITLQCIAGGVSPEVMAETVAKALGQVLGLYAEPQQASAFFRIEAAKLEAATMPVAGAPIDVAEMMELGRKVQTFIDTLQLAGIEEGVAVTAVANAVVERMARYHGAKGSAAWLRRLADVAEQNETAINQMAGFS